MQLINKFVKYWYDRNIYPTFRSTPSWLLAILGGPASVVAFYLWVIVGIVTPEYLKVVNNYGFDLDGVALGLFIIFLASAGLYFSAIATRAGELLYRRYFG